MRSPFIDFYGIWLAYHDLEDTSENKEDASKKHVNIRRQLICGDDGSLDEDLLCSSMFSIKTGRPGTAPQSKTIKRTLKPDMGQSRKISDVRGITYPNCQAVLQRGLRYGIHYHCCCKGRNQYFVLEKSVWRLRRINQMLFFKHWKNIKKIQHPPKRQKLE